MLIFAALIVYQNNQVRTFSFPNRDMGVIADKDNFKRNHIIVNTHESLETKVLTIIADFMERKTLPTAKCVTGS